MRWYDLRSFCVIAVCFVVFAVAGLVGCGKQNSQVGGSPKAGGASANVNPKDGAAMILIPAGKFAMGSKAGEKDAGKDQMPQHTVHLDAYYIYRDLVTVGQYKKFCKATNRKMPDSPTWGWIDDHPMVMVTWDDANSYAQWAGGSLPTEAQWEKAARGTDGRIYPWGNKWDSSKLHCSKVTWGDALKTASVGSCTTGASPYGVSDMAGNVWQWCSDYYDPLYYRTSPSRNPAGPKSGSRRVLRGGSWSSIAPGNFRTARRLADNPVLGFIGSGFRCVVKAPGK